MSGREIMDTTGGGSTGEAAWHEQWKEADQVRAGLEGSWPLTSWLLEHSEPHDISALPKARLEHESATDGETPDSEGLPSTLHSLELPMVTSNGEGTIFDQARQVGGVVEQLVLDGIRNFPHPLTEVKTELGDHVVVQTVLRMRTRLQLGNWFGPYFILHGFKNGYHAVKMHHVASAVDDMVGSVCSTLLAPDDLFLVQNTLDVIRLVVGQMPEVVEQDGRKVVCACVVSQVRRDFVGGCGIAKLCR